MFLEQYCVGNLRNGWFPSQRTSNKNKSTGHDDPLVHGLCQLRIQQNRLAVLKAIQMSAGSWVGTAKATACLDCVAGTASSQVGATTQD